MRNAGDRNKGDKKKLSWIYRKKVKAQRFKNPKRGTNDAIQDNKKARIIVRNLPFKATENDVKRFYEPFGEIEEINLLKHPDGKPVGCGFIQFKRIEEASKAIFNTNKKEFLGRVINSSWAISKSKFCEKLEKAAKQEGTVETENETEETAGLGESQDTEVKDDESKTTEGKYDENKSIGNKGKYRDPAEIEKLKLEKQKQRKLHKDINRKKRARIVIRNLAFHAIEEDLQKHFGQYGTIEEIKILKRGDGKHVGCAFLQFEHVQSAAKAIHYANMKPLLDRPIVVDWAVPKTKFTKADQPETADEDVKVKIEKDIDAEEPVDTKEDIDLSNVNEELGSEAEAEDDKDDNESVTELGETSDMKDEDDDNLSEQDEEVAEDEVKRPRRESHDISEGKTVFIKNLPFSVKNDQLRRYMEQFGPVYYALVCIDSLTEFSKGTAFVKFRNVEDAEKCLAAGNQLQMEDQILEAHRALERNDIENKASARERRMKDTRNLYLVKEGVVLAGSPAANGVSAADMAKRLQIEQWKSQILRNLNMYVARVRLVVHNLPPSLDDAKLRKIFERHSGPNAVIKEARVMRDLKNVDAKGVGKSKEYGFVSFTSHDDAIKALRSVNNNPNVFTPHRRPIVSFSIENRIMVNAKQKRIQKSRDLNPLWAGGKAKRKNDDSEEKVPTKKSKPENSEESDVKPYAGTVGKPGQNKLRTKFKLKNQAMLHNQTLKKEKKQNKFAKKLQEKQKEKQRSRSEVKPKQGRKVNPDDVNLDKLVNSYKNKLQSMELKKSKWYET